VYLFGGLGPQGLLGDLWSWDGRRWSRISAELTPEDTIIPGDIADEGSAGFGDAANAALNGSSSGLEGLIGDPTTFPTPRFKMAFAFDELRNELVIYGGFAGINQAPDGAQWRSSTGGLSWDRRTDGPAVAGGAYGMVGSTLIVVGGVDKVLAPRSSWLKVPLAGAPVNVSSPLAQGRVGACGMTTPEGVVVLGGAAGTSALTPLVVGPDLTLAVEPSLGILPRPLIDGACGKIKRTTFFGGRNPEVSTQFDTTHAFTGSTWATVGLGGFPSPRKKSAVAVFNGSALVVGGDLPGGAQSSEAWEFLGGWQPAQAVGLLPGLSGAGMACSSITCLIVGGVSEGSLRTRALSWTPGTTASDVATPGLGTIADAAVALDRRTGTLFVFGSPAGNASGLATTCKAGDPFLSAGPISFDCVQETIGPTTAGGAVMVESPGGPFLWAEGKLWRRHDRGWVTHGSGGPPARANPVLAAETNRATGAFRLWLFGGEGVDADGDDTLLNDLWSFEAETWREHQPVDPEGDGAPEGRVGHAGFFDGETGRLVIANGHTTSGHVADTWEFITGDDARAAIVVNVNLDGADDFEEVTVSTTGSGTHVISTFFIDDAPMPATLTLRDASADAGLRFALLPKDSGSSLSIDSIDVRLIRMAPAP
jgi:hypothetical protein